MPLQTTRASRCRTRLSAILSWTRHSSIIPITLNNEFDKELQLETERRRELQLTLDKLEGRVIVTSQRRFRRTSDKSFGDICGLMSMLGEGLQPPAYEEEVPDDHFCGDRLGDDDAFIAFGTGELQDDGCIASHPVEVTGVGEVELPLSIKLQHITHPAFSSYMDVEEKWDTSSRVSDDSFFNGHERQRPSWASQSGSNPFSCFRYSLILLRNVKGITDAHSKQYS